MGCKMVQNGQAAMEHDTRKMIYNHITHYPGVTFSVLKNIFELAEGTLRYHLKYLEKADTVCSDIQDGNRCYYPQKKDQVLSKMLENHSGTYKFTKNQKRIMAIIQQYPGINQKDLIKKAKLNRFTLNYNLNKFIDLGVIRKINNSGRVFYEFITDDLMEHEIMKLLIIKLLNNEIDENTFNELKEKLENS